MIIVVSLLSEFTHENLNLLDHGFHIFKLLVIYVSPYWVASLHC